MVVVVQSDSSEDNEAYAEEGNRVRMAKRLGEDNEEKISSELGTAEEVHTLLRAASLLLDWFEEVNLAGGSGDGDGEGDSEVFFRHRRPPPAISYETVFACQQPVASEHQFMDTGGFTKSFTSTTSVVGKTQREGQARRLLKPTRGKEKAVAAAAVRNF
ncbi:unnamed protein product [Soboliphyme baturini]|uniref:Uncharacterized protein n=1 Tax=Soboliphyme baturini TaxID=241478 RepID=A0A183IX52_9BILA|nr:unnamed protein product [Soboliphyme baturini]